MKEQNELTCWLYIIAGGGFMHADTNCAVFKTYESADLWIKNAYGYTHSEIVEAFEKLQDWFEGEFLVDCPYNEDFCISVFGAEEPANWDEMCEQEQMQMPYGLTEMEFGKVSMVIGQGSYS